MFGGGNQHAFFHQAGGIADPSDVAADRLNLEAIQVGSPKDNPTARGRRNQAQVNGSAAVETDSLTFHSCANCLFLNQALGDISLEVIRLQGERKCCMW